MSEREDRIVREYLDDLSANQRPALNSFLARFPDLDPAERDSVTATLRVLELAGRATADVAAQLEAGRARSWQALEAWHAQAAAARPAQLRAPALPADPTAGPGLTFPPHNRPAPLRPARLSLADPARPALRLVDVTPDPDARAPANLFRLTDYVASRGVLLKLSALGVCVLLCDAAISYLRHGDPPALGAPPARAYAPRRRRLPPGSGERRAGPPDRRGSPEDPPAPIRH